MEGGIGRTDLGSHFGTAMLVVGARKSVEGMLVAYTYTYICTYDF